MPSTWTRKYLGKEDITFHDPATGTAAQSFTRSASDPLAADVNVTKVSALDIPLRDAVVVAGAATPFEGLADTQAAKNVETALADIRKNIPHYRNVEHYGMVQGDNSNAVAEKNTAVWNKIIADIGATGLSDGIFFPGGAWYFKDTAGTEVLSGAGLSNIKVVGTGPGCSPPFVPSAHHQTHRLTVAALQQALLAEVAKQPSRVVTVVLGELHHPSSSSARSFRPR